MFVVAIGFDLGFVGVFSVSCCAVPVQLIAWKGSSLKLPVMC